MDSRPSSKKKFLGLDAEAPALFHESLSACHEGITNTIGIAAERPHRASQHLLTSQCAEKPGVG
jgi:hypothetical protein